MMGVDSELKRLVREAIREELVDGRVLRDQLHAALEETFASPPEVSSDDEVDTRTAAAIAHVRPRTISDWKRNGLLTPVKRGKQHVFRVGDVLAVARNRGGPRKILNMEAEARRILSRRREKGGT